MYGGVGEASEDYLRGARFCLSNPTRDHRYFAVDSIYVSFQKTYQAGPWRVAISMATAV